MDGPTYERHTQTRLTTAQKNLVVVYLKRLELISAKVRGGHTGPAWRTIFSVTNSKVPDDPCRWPAVDEWMDGLSMSQGHDLIRHLKARLGIKGQS